MKNLPEHIRYLLYTYLTGILAFTVFRLILFITQIDKIGNIPDGGAFWIMIQSFFMGFRFDTVISGYILLLPTLLLSLNSLFKNKFRWVTVFSFWFILVLYLIAFLICAIDIPYFNHFFNRFSAVAFTWTDDSDFILGMVFQEFKYWGAAIPLIIISFAYILFSIRLRNRTIYKEKEKQNHSTASLNVMLSMIVLLLLMIGVRGRFTTKSPIRAGTAYFSNYTLPNKLGLNPVYTFIVSTIRLQKEENRELELMEPDKAINKCREYLHITNPLTSISPIARRISNNAEANKANVVIVIMESMSAAKMGIFGNPDKLTPNLDTLAQRGYFFTNVYTAGIHTFNGIFSTLFSYPSLKKQHPMKTVEMNKYAGISSVLKPHGYKSIYFTTHDDQFDNVGGFLTANDFNEIISQEDYPSDKVESTLGVPDDYLFEFSLPILDEAFENKSPFLAVYMTASDHGPYIVPEYFTPKSENIRKQVVEYADWSIAKFIQNASTKPWFDNTIFVFIADHGAPIEPRFDIPLNYLHTPLIIYSPSIIREAQTFDKPGSQIDVFPTIMGLLNIDYINNTFGIDLIRENRGYINFCSDDKIGVLDSSRFLIVREDGSKALYNYKDDNPSNLAGKEPETLERLEDYYKSILQTAQWMKSNKKTGL